MRTPASIAGHPIHAMLVPIAIGTVVAIYIANAPGWLGGKLVYEHGAGVDMVPPR